MFRTDYLSQQKQKGSAKTIHRSKIFRTTYRTKSLGQAMYRSKNVPDRLSAQNVPDRLFIGATNTANGKLHSKLVEIYFS